MRYCRKGLLKSDIIPCYSGLPNVTSVTVTSIIKSDSIYHHWGLPKMMSKVTSITVTGVYPKWDQGHYRQGAPKKTPDSLSQGFA